MAIETVVFDLDGVIVDTHGAWFEVRQQLAEKHSGRWTHDDERAVMGVNSSHWARYMHDEAGVDLPANDIYVAVVEELKRRYTDELEAFPGAREAIVALAGRFRLGVASGSPIELIEHALTTVGLRWYFDEVLSADEVCHGKPQPDVYLAACRRLGAEPSAAAAIEDSANGIQAAISAGMPVVAIPNKEFPPAKEVVSLAHRILTSISELTVEVVDTLTLETGGV